MDTNLFRQFVPVLRDMTDADLAIEIGRPQRLLIEDNIFRGKNIEVAYAPFDHVNLEAKIAIVGLTPGRQQMHNALFEARRSLLRGSSEEQAMRDAKIFASFSGPMRANLVAMLDSIGVNHRLGILSTSTLWNSDANLVHFTSALRYPVFVDGMNYSGAPSIITTPLLQKHLIAWFSAEMAALPNAIFVPLGPNVTAAVELAARQIGLSASRLLSGLPHPSGANSERIAFFLGRKSRDMLSNKVEPERLLAARTSLEAKILAWVK
ncbi:hypothetical protein [Methylocella tundrae]|uniref:Uracil DNA glycosylase superfamily protein n=1 Tax=Methylocella tundrae TaxID=227605 RepID=A0A4U8Z392_METTU|nr:hypothetical protein [Methylocella tundrae]WPP03695.1 hypothetical protein SIN04_14645 [Methylocella tundrae]VFU09836.1 Uracil DNA glycosylase superfamily protein [Methylocella tundrae]